MTIPNEMSYSVAWSRSVNTTGFEVCIHESVFFSGAHSALLVGLYFIALNFTTVILVGKAGEYVVLVEVLD